MPYKDVEKRRSYRRYHYSINKEKYKQSKNQTKDKIRRIIQQAKSKSCTDCKNSFPYYVMDFDHVRGEKKFNIGESVSCGSSSRVLEEIEKCDLVCANCHRVRTYNRLQGV